VPDEHAVVGDDETVVDEEQGNGNYSIDPEAAFTADARLQSFRTSSHNSVRELI